MSAGVRSQLGSRALLGLAMLLALPVAPVALAAEEPVALGRLFLSPAERRELDAHRGEAVTAEGDAALPKDLLPARAAAPERLVMNGLVRRQRGAPVVWVNGRPLESGAANLDAQGGVTVRSEGKGAVRLRPGQTWNRATGEVSDCVQCVAPPVGGAQAPTQSNAPEEPVGGAQAPTQDASPATVAQSQPASAP